MTTVSAHTATPFAGLTVGDLRHAIENPSDRDHAIENEIGRETENYMKALASGPAIERLASLVACEAMKTGLLNVSADMEQALGAMELRTR